VLANIGVLDINVLVCNVSVFVHINSYNVCTIFAVTPLRLLAARERLSKQYPSLNRTTTSS
jgi:hypothetical protein